MADRTVRAEDNGAPLLDADDEPIKELAIDDVDALDEESATVVELAAGQRSWRFGHVIVDEAQDLTPMQWRMVARRARGNSMTIVGDLAQRSVGTASSWAELLPDDLAEQMSYRELTINYRSPTEVHDLTASVLAELAPGLSPGRPIRSVGHQPEFVEVTDMTAELDAVVERSRAAASDGRVAVIGHDLPELPERPGVRLLSPHTAKGLEFDVVIVVEPARILDEVNGLGQLYVALTRTTDRLLIVHEQPRPAVLKW